MKKILLILFLLTVSTAFGQWKRITIDSAYISGAWFRGLTLSNEWTADQTFKVIIGDSVRGSIFRNKNGGAIFEYDTNKFVYTGEKLFIKTGGITSSVVTDNNTQDEHLIYEASINGTGKGKSSVLIVYLERKAPDSYADVMRLLSVDIHYQIESFGTKREYPD